MHHKRMLTTLTLTLTILESSAALAVSRTPYAGPAKFFSTALGADLAHGQRCVNFDHLASNAESIERMEWAFYCNYVPTTYRIPWTLMIDPITKSVVPRGLNQYPVFAQNHPIRGWTRWTPNLQKTDYHDGKGPVYDCSMPDDVIWYAVCEASCYTANQRILFASGHHPIHHASETDKLDLITLSPDATFEQLRFVINRAQRYTQDIEPTVQPVIGFFTKSGAELVVTPGHPLVTIEGTLKTANEFFEHEPLVRADGSSDEIVAITHEDYNGTVYNVMPETTDLVSNIVVAEGFLSGSTRYQNEYIEYMNRLVTRETIPVGVLVP